MSFGEKLKMEYLQSVDKEAIFKGCNDDEVDKLGKLQGVSYIPLLYRDLLLKMGRIGMGKILDGEATYDYLTYLKESFLREIARSNLNCPKDIFVFFGHHDYIFYFFRTKLMEPNPIVYGYFEAYNGFVKLSNTLSYFFERRVEWLKRKNFEIPDIEILEIDLYYDADKDEFTSDRTLNRSSE